MSSPSDDWEADFIASRVFCGEIGDGVIGVIVAETEEGSRVELQRRTAFDDQDLALGHDTYCLSVNTGASVYGGVARWVIIPGRLQFLLTRAASEALQLNAKLRIGFDERLTVNLREWLLKVIETAPS